MSRDPNSNRPGVRHIVRDMAIAAGAAAADTGLNYWSFVLAKQAQAGLIPKFPTSPRAFFNLYRGVSGFLPPYAAVLGSEMAISHWLEPRLRKIPCKDVVATILAGSTAGVIFAPVEHAIVEKAKFEIQTGKTASVANIMKTRIQQCGLRSYLTNQVRGYRYTAGREALSATVLFSFQERVRTYLAARFPILRAQKADVANFWASLSAAVLLAPVLATVGQLPGICAATEQERNARMSISTIWSLFREQARAENRPVTSLITRGLGWRWFTLTGTLLTVRLATDVLESLLPKCSF